MIHTDGRPTIANAVREYTEGPSDHELWRIEQLANAGVPHALAAEIDSYHYGLVMSLIERGCDPELAALIAGN